MAYGNPQHSSVFSTRGLEEAPKQTLWKSLKLFQYRALNTTEGTSGPLRLIVDIPTFQAISSPIISSGLIFFTFHTENAYLYAIDAINGKERVVLKFDKNALSALAAIGGTVYFGNRSGIHAFDVENRVEKWAFEQKGLSFSDSVPVIEDGILYMYGAGKGAGLYAFKAETGEVKWKYPSAEFLNGPAIGGDHLVLVKPKGSIVALDKTTGAEKWEAKIDSDASAPAILEDQIFVTLESGEVRAYGLEDGSFKWKAKKSGGTRTALVLFKGKVIYGGRDDSIIALDARSGLEAWKFRTNLPCYRPLIAGDLFYVVCGDHKMYSLDPVTGAEKWRMDNKKATPPPPFFADGVMYTLGTDGFLYAMR